MAWFPLTSSAQASAAAARLDGARAAVSAAHAAAITAELANRDPADGVNLSYADALEVICRATGWPVGHAWLRTAEGWEPSSTWHDSGPTYDALDDATATTDLGPGRGIVAAVLFLESCRFLQGLEGLGSVGRSREAAALGLRALVGVPVVRNGRVDAVLEFITTDDVEPEGSLTDALLAVAGRTRRWLPTPVAKPTPEGPDADHPPIELAG